MGHLDVAPCGHVGERGAHRHGASARHLGERRSRRRRADRDDLGQRGGIFTCKLRQMVGDHFLGRVGRGRTTRSVGCRAGLPAVALVGHGALFAARAAAVELAVPARDGALRRFDVTRTREPEEKLESLSRRGQLGGQRAPRGRVDALRVREQRHRALLERRSRGAGIREYDVGRRVIDPLNEYGRREPFSHEVAKEVLGAHPVGAEDVHRLGPWNLEGRHVAPILPEGVGAGERRDQRERVFGCLDTKLGRARLHLGDLLHGEQLRWHDGRDGRDGPRSGRFDAKLGRALLPARQLLLRQWHGRVCWRLQRVLNDWALARL